MADQIAPLYDLKPATLKAQIQAESGWNPHAVSYVWARDKKGRLLLRNGKPYKVPCAYGIAQFIPSTGRGYGLNGLKDLFNPEKAIHAMARKMSGAINYYRGKGQPVELAKQNARIEYNCGRKCVHKSGRIPQNGETPKYLRNIAKYEQHYQKLELAETRRAE